MEHLEHLEEENQWGLDVPGSPAVRPLKRSQLEACLLLECSLCRQQSGSMVLGLLLTTCGICLYLPISKRR